MSPFLLTGLAILIYFGLLQRVLDRMRLSDRAALVLIGIMVVGNWLPEIPLGPIRINIGGVLVPVGISIYLVGTADEYKEQVRAIWAIIATTAAILILDWVLPQEPGAMFIDPMYAYGIAAGIIGYLAGRSRRGAFVAGMMGILLADTIIILQQLPVTSTVQLGGGVFDAALISGLIAVGIAELVGETREFIAPDDQKNKVVRLSDKRREKNRQNKGRK